MRPLRVAFAGVRHGHVLGLADMLRKDPEFEIAGVFEPDEEARAAARPLFPEGFYASYPALLADQTVDVVAVGDYFQARGERILTALKAGKHVISDKPICTDLRELEEIEKLQAGTGLALVCMLDLRYDPALRYCRELVRNGSLGEIHNVNFTGQHPLDWGKRPKWYFVPGKQGGTLNDLAIHGIDAVSMITGQPFRRVTAAREWNAFAREAPAFKDCAHLMMELKNGAGVLGDVSYSAPSPTGFSLPSYWRFSFWGEKGMLECKLGNSEILFAAAGDPEIRRLQAPPVEDSYLLDLKRMIRHEDPLFPVSDLFDSARAALLLQKCADSACL